MVEKIRIRLMLTTIKFQKMEDLVKAIGLPKEKLCTHAGIIVPTSESHSEDDSD